MGVETTIRDFLATNLQLISNDFILIEKEYKLHNHAGSKGYIDILAKDTFGNFVIIEIKRSKASSRETIQEIIKYVGLLKQNFKARDSEIKIVILSTDWSELLIPFSELCYQTTLDVTGFKLILNSSKQPVGKEPVRPIKTGAKRQIARQSILPLFRTEEKRQQCIQYLESRCKLIGIEDFLMIQINSGENTNPAINNRFALCFAFQSMTTEMYLNIISKANTEMDMQEDEFEDHDEFISYLEDLLLVSLEINRYCDTLETGTPEKLNSVLGMEGWIASSIQRFGIFKTDPRYSDEQLLTELRGLDGSNEIMYNNFGELSQTDRFNEIRENCVAPLKYNKIWANHITGIFNYIEHINQPCRFVVSVYYPVSIFDTIWRVMKKGDMNYQPLYLIFVDFIGADKVWIFGGRLSWSKKAIDLDKTTKYLTDNNGSFINKFLDCMMGRNDDKILKLYNLNYENTLAEFQGENLNADHNILFEKNKLFKSDNNGQSFSEWLDSNGILKDILSTLYAEYTNYFHR